MGTEAHKYWNFIDLLVFWWLSNQQRWHYIVIRMFYSTLYHFLNSSYTPVPSVLVLFQFQFSLTEISLSSSNNGRDRESREQLTDWRPVLRRRPGCRWRMSPVQTVRCRVSCQCTGLHRRYAAAMWQTFTHDWLTDSLTDYNQPVTHSRLSWRHTRPRPRHRHRVTMSTDRVCW